jgi:glycosyltransferase involved in cell wall biosynthesis
MSQEKSAVFAQDLYPGAWLEPEWSRIDVIRKTPEYALRLALGAQVIESPRGRPEFTSIIFEGKEYVLATKNMDAVRKLTSSFLTDFLKPKGYANVTDHWLRFQPNLIIDGMSFLLDQSVRDLDVPLERSRMIWIVPDLGSCGDYRSNKPFKYMETKPEFFTERTEFASPNAMPWYDAFIMHRAPQPQVLSVCQQLKIAGKVLIYEADDDLFNIPTWNHNHAKHTPAVLNRVETAMALADVGFMSTSHLQDVSVDRMPNAAIFVTPNLIDFTEIGEALKCDRALNSLDTYHPIYRNGGTEFVSREPGRMKKYECKEGEYNPVTVLWAGSNTHDYDLQDIIEPILSIGKKHGLGVRFVFFGYCPNEFITVESEAGHTSQKVVVREEYRYFITYFPGVAYPNYMASLREIDPDIALCPLAKHEFNLGKSNLKALEMGALGIPVIASDYGPYAETIKDGTDGLLVSTPEDWQDAMETLIQEAETRKLMGSLLRKKVYDQYSWQTDNENRQKWDRAFEWVHQLAQERR